jgi:hypothetical protein
MIAIAGFLAGRIWGKRGDGGWSGILYWIFYLLVLRVDMAILGL